MKRSVKSLSDIGTLGKTPQDYIAEIKAGRSGAVEGIRRMAVAYDEMMRRFSNAEEFIKKDPELRWLSRNTRRMLRMIANNDLDERILMIPERNLAGFLEELPVKRQKDILDKNPYIQVVDRGSGAVQDVAYIDVTSADTKIAYDQKEQRFRTVQEQRVFIANMKAAARRDRESWRPYKTIGNIVRFEKRCELGRNELAELCRQMGLVVSE